MQSPPNLFILLSLTNMLQKYFLIIFVGMASKKCIS